MVLQYSVLAEVNDLLPQGYWATTSVRTEGVLGSVQIAVYQRPDPKGLPWGEARPVVQLSVGEYYRSDQFETARYIKGRLTISGWLEWQPFPDLETAVCSLITQHRLGVGNA